MIWQVVNTSVRMLQGTAPIRGPKAFFFSHPWSEGLPVASEL